MNQNQQRLSVVERAMDRTIEYPEPGIPGVRLLLGEQSFYIQIRRALRARFPKAERVALYFPACDGKPEGWRYYDRAVLPNRFGNRLGCRSMDLVTEGMGDK